MTAEQCVAYVELQILIGVSTASIRFVENAEKDCFGAVIWP